MWRNLVVVFSLFSFSACTSMRTLEDLSPSTIREQVHVGDRASVLYGSGRVQYDITVTGVDADALHGVTGDGKAYKFPFEKIRDIDVERTSKGKTAIAIVSVAVTAFVILLILSIRNWDPGGGGESGSGNGGD